MKKVSEIPECDKLIDEMLEKMDKVSTRKGYDANYIARKQVEKEYIPKILDVYNKYKKKHPEEFKEE